MPGDRPRRRWSEGQRPRRTRTDAARAGHRAGKACHWRRSAYGRPRGQPSMIRGGSRMQESCTYGSVRGAPSNGRPYRNRQIGERFRDFVRDGVKRLRGAAVSSEHLPASTDITGQSELAWENMLRVLSKADMTVDDIVKVTQYLTRAEDIKACSQVRNRFLGTARPASMLLVIPQLVWPNLLVEVEIIAAKGS